MSDLTWLLRHQLKSALLQNAGQGQSGATRDAFLIDHLLDGINSQDEVEAMLVTQMIASHMLAMDCMRLAELPNQTLDGREYGLPRG